MKNPSRLALLLLLGCTSPIETQREASFVGPHRDLLFTQSSGSGAPEAHEGFGEVLATGDFDGDGYADLAIGVPGADRIGVDSGEVLVLLGGFSGLGSGGHLRLTQMSSNNLSRPGDRFGASLAAGDFDGDGVQDLAVGAPGTQVGAASKAGAVYVFRGSRAGLASTFTTRFTQASVSGAAAAADERFGAALAAGDFDGDRFDDLAVGSPGEAVGAAVDVGAVSIFRGSGRGLRSTGSVHLTQGMLPGQLDEAGDAFGGSLAAGDFDADGFADLAVGALGQALVAAPNAGMVLVLYGAPSGLLPARLEALTLFDTGAPPQARSGFGAALAVGDFDGQGGLDLAVGVPGLRVDVHQDAGAVVAYYGTAAGLRGGAPHVLNTLDAGQEVRPGDRFGAALGAADLDGDGRADLAVGAPARALNLWEEAGAVGLFYGTASGLRPVRPLALSSFDFGLFAGHGWRFGAALAGASFDGSRQAQLAVGIPGRPADVLPRAGAVVVSALEPAAPAVTALSAIVIDTATGRVLGAKAPDARRPIASTTKIMTALLAVEDIAAGLVTLNTQVVIGANPPQVGGGMIGLAVGDRISLGDLLNALLLVSGNDTAVAIAEVLSGSEAAFVARMNARASALGLGGTSFVNSSGRDPEDLFPGVCSGFQPNVPACAHFSTARDLARLARFALGDANFSAIVGQNRATPSTWVDSRGAARTATWCNSNALLHSTTRCNPRPVTLATSYGVKTGTSDLAGPCLVAAARNPGAEDVISVVLASTSTMARFTDSVDLLQFGLQVPSP